MTFKKEFFVGTTCEAKENLDVIKKVCLVKELSLYL